MKVITVEKRKEYEANKTRNKQMTVRATEEENKLIKDASKELNATLTELLLEGVRALKEKHALTKQ